MNHWRRIALLLSLTNIVLTCHTGWADDVLLEETFEFFELDDVWREHEAGAPDITFGVGFSDGSEVLQMVSSGLEEAFYGIETIAPISLAGLADIKVDARLRPINQGAEGSIAAAEVALIGASGEVLRAFASNNAGPDPDFMNDWGDHYEDSLGNTATSGPWPHCTDKGGPGCDAMRNLVLILTTSGLTIQAFDDNSDPDIPRWETTIDDVTLADLGNSVTIALRQLAVEGGDNVAGYFDNLLVTTSGAVAIEGDFDGNGVLDAADIDDLTAQSASGENVLKYDLNQDARVDDDDVKVWIKDLFQSWVGDANLDHEFNSADLVEVLASGAYESAQPSTWSSGDFNGDGQTDSSDLVASLADGGYELGRPAVAQPVPEPATHLLLIAGVLLWAQTRFPRT